MTPLRMPKGLKSVVAAVVSGSLFVTSAVTPAAAQVYRAGTAAEAGSAARGGFAPSTTNGVQPLPSLLVGSASLAPALSPALSPAGAPSALAKALPAAASAEGRNDEPAKPVIPARPVKPGAQEDGPRWTKTGGDKKAAAPDAGPRWTGPAKGGVRAALAKYLPFLRKSGDEAFDGAASGKGDVEASVAAKGEASSASGLVKPSARASRIIEDHAIPTPEAARRVGELRRDGGTPLRAKIAAPVSVLAAAAVAIHFGAVPVLTLAAGLVVSVLAHEIAHIAVLHRLGDHTAEHAGSRSLNPFAHIDAVKTVIVPALSLAVSSLLLPFPILLGAGKPVDADFNNLRSPFGGARSARNAFWVAAAGPATNLAIAGLAFGAAALLPAGGALAVVALGLAKMNLALAAFNMLPLPQLDGGKILASVLPERFYAKWVFNPRVERGYQGVFRRLYEGPSNVLTWLADALGVRTQKGVNRLANTVTFTALAAFYAAAYFHFAVALPLLFLALPCSYDYWCIREKVRSEAAVRDLMEIMSQWSAVIVQIAEDLGLESEVSAYETEHAMKNALETLVDEMMAKEEFRALSDEQKLEALMKEYPDKAAQYLKDKAMPEDSLEKIKAVLADPRNAPFYERLRKWFKEHEIFARWDNQHAQGKLKDALKDADKEKGRGAGALELPENLVSRGVSALMKRLSAPATPDGPGDPGTPDPMDKVTAEESASVNVIAVDILPGTADADIERLFAGLEYFATARAAGYYRIEIANRSDADVITRRLARDPAVRRIVVHPDLYERALALPVPVPVAPRAPAASWLDKVKVSNGRPQERVRAVFRTAEAARAAFNRLSAAMVEMLGSTVIEATPGTTVQAAEIARALADEADVKVVVVSSSVHDLLMSRGRRTAPAAPEPRVEPAELPVVPEPAAEKPVLPAKVSSHGKAEFSVNALLVQFAPGTPETALRAALDAQGQRTVHRHGDLYTVTTDDAADAAKRAAAMSYERSVEAIKVHPNVAAILVGDPAPYPDAPGFDHERAILVEFREGATEETIADYADVRRLRLVHRNFRGSERAALLEVPAGADVAATLRMLVDETAAPHSAAASVRPFQEQPGAPELKPSVQAQAAAEAEAAPVPAPAPPRRDPAQAWQEHLQNVTLSDGKSKLNDKQVQLLTMMLKPMAKAPEEKRPPVVGRGEEIKRILPIVTSPRGMRNSVILVGEPGVGKTAVPEGLAEMIEDAEAAAAADSRAFLQFERLKGRWLVELDIDAILAQEDPVGALGAVLNLLPRLNQGGPSRGNDVIVVMDQIEKLFEHRDADRLTSLLIGPLRDGKISAIGTITEAKYKAHFENAQKDNGFKRRFEKIEIGEPSVERTITILRAMKSWLQGLHDASIPDQALVDAAKLADQFDKTNFNPDKAIKAVQDAAELSRPDNLRAAITLDLRETWGELVVAVNEARQALVDKGIASTLALPVDAYNKIAVLVQKAEALYGEREAVADGKGQVTTEVVKRVIAAKTGIASGQLNLGEDDAARYTKMEEEIGRRVVNQGPALTAIANAVRRNKAGLSNPNRPMGKFLLTGPTGVGKTYLAKELARFLFNDPEAMIRMDMSEYMEEHTAQRLTGSPPGYVGYGEGGQLTEAVRKKPYSVILFDEVEKAHPKVFDVLLQILDDGRLTDGQGRTVDFKNTVIIMTSNAGMAGVDGEKYAKLLEKIASHNAAAEQAGKPLPTVDEVNKTWDEEIDLMVGAALKERFRPEFLNRLDEDPTSKNKWIRVNRLRAEDIAKIATIQLDEFKRLLADRHDTDIHFEPSVVDFLSVEGYSPLYGARPMTAAIEKNIIDPLAQWILKEAEAGKKDVRGSAIKVSYEDGRIVFTASPKPEKNTARATVQGASEAVAAAVFSLIERLSSAGEGEEPTENLFDKWMRDARPARERGAGNPGVEPAGQRTRAFFAPGVRLAVAGGGMAAEHNNAKKKDAKVRIAITGARESALATGWKPEVLDVLDPPAGQVGEGWLKQLVKLAKEQAAKAGTAAPVEIAAAIDGNKVQLAVSGAYALSADDQKALIMHFSGTPPASYLAAQQKADNLNLSARLLWDHNLLDLYRRLSAIPGARMGFATGPEGTQIWLEIRRETGPPAAEKKLAAASTGDGLSPHQLREAAKVRELMMRIIDQSRLKESDRDGHAIRIAAAEGYASLAQPSDAATARGWIAAKGWGGDVGGAAASDVDDEWDGSSAKVSNEVGAEWPLAMTAALILERFGGAEDVLALENMARRVTGNSHYEVPVHNALVQALSAIYARLGLAATRAALRRAAQLKAGRATDIAEAARRALGTVGMPADLDEAKLDADAYLAMMKRLGRQDELLKVFRDNAAWGANTGDPVRQAALKLAGETEAGDEALNRLKNMMKTQTSYSRTGYEMSRAWAQVVAREGLVGGLGDAMKRYLDARGVKDYSLGSSWPILYAYVVAASRAGGADVLQPLEELMRQPPGDIASVNEQAYFSSPDAWARALIRSGKFEEYSRSQGLDAGGAPKPSKLQEMLIDKAHPMLVAGALRAIAYARDPRTLGAHAEPRGPVPDIHPGPGSSGSGGAFGPYHSRFDDRW